MDTRSKTKPSTTTRRITNAMAGLTLFATVGSGCAHDPPPPAADPTVEYRMGRDDLIDVSVWKEPALSATVPVRPDGRISLPMIGELQAEGRTAADIRSEVEKKLAPLVPSPVVTVILKEVHAARFYVLGEVAHPGMYPLNGTLTVIEAVAIAGGTTEFARTGRLTVIRRSNGKPQHFRVDLSALVNGNVAPVPLSPGDTVYVP